MNPPRSRNLTPSQAAAHLAVSAKALRLYEERGLLAPGRTAGGWRVYGSEDLDRAATIVSLRALGLSLSEVARVMKGDPSALGSALAAQEERLLAQARRTDATLRKVRSLRDDVRRGRHPDASRLSAALGRDSDLAVGFELPWPWAGQWFELAHAPLTFITGPLGSGKTCFAERLAAELPDAVFVGPDRLDGGSAARRLEEDPSLAGSVRCAMDWLAGEGAEPNAALLDLVVVLEGRASAVLVIDMVEQGLSQASQRALMAWLRANAGKWPALFLMTRSSSILDLEMADGAEMAIYCPANHDVPFAASLHPGGYGFEALEMCLATPEARARTSGIVAVRSAAAF